MGLPAPHTPHPFVRRETATGNYPCAEAGTSSPARTMLWADRRAGLPAPHTVQGIPHAHVRAGASVDPTPRVHLPARNSVQGILRAHVTMGKQEKEREKSKKKDTPWTSPRALISLGASLRIRLPARVSQQVTPCRDLPAPASLGASSRGVLPAPTSPHTSLWTQMCGGNTLPTPPGTDIRGGNTPHSCARRNLPAPNSSGANTCRDYPAANSSSAFPRTQLHAGIIPGACPHEGIPREHLLAGVSLGGLPRIPSIVYA
ncbi:hypothetical protein B0H13DRAFT_2528737 [Mycena leptocephala]|nr:hypothetical protein B0H13DRAFT_2528737 [Mycena leptocephala]